MRKHPSVRLKPLLGRGKDSAEHIIAEHDRKIDMKLLLYQLHRHSAVTVAGINIRKPARFALGALVRIADRHDGHGVRRLILPDDVRDPVRFGKHIIGYRLSVRIDDVVALGSQAFEPFRLRTREALPDCDLVGGKPLKLSILDMLHYHVVHIGGRLIRDRIHIGNAVLAVDARRGRCDDVACGQAHIEHRSIPVHRGQGTDIARERNSLHIVLALPAIGKDRRLVFVPVPFFIKLEPDEIIAVAPDNAEPCGAFRKLVPDDNIDSNIFHITLLLLFLLLQSCSSSPYPSGYKFRL